MRVFGLLSRFESDPDFRGRLIPKVCLNVTTAQVELWVKVAFFEVACSDVAHKGREKGDLFFAVFVAIHFLIGHIHHFFEAFLDRFEKDRGPGTYFRGFVDRFF